MPDDTQTPAPAAGATGGDVTVLAARVSALCQEREEWRAAHKRACDARDEAERRAARLTAELAAAVAERDAYEREVSELADTLGEATTARVQAEAELAAARGVVLDVTRPCVAIGCTTCPRHRLLAALAPAPRGGGGGGA